MLHEDIVAGLLECFWPGRCQILQFGNNKYAPYKRQHDHVIIAGVFSFRLYIDGAHTQESIEVCAQWFKEATSKSQAQIISAYLSLSSDFGLLCYVIFLINSTAKKMLIFNVTGNRNGNDLLDILHNNVQFHVALFTPNISSLTTKTSGKTNIEQDQCSDQICIHPSFGLDFHSPVVYLQTICIRWPSQIELQSTVFTGIRWPNGTYQRPSIALQMYFSSWTIITATRKQRS